MAKIPRVPVENQITTLSVVKIAIKFSSCTIELSNVWLPVRLDSLVALAIVWYRGLITRHCRTYFWCGQEDFASMLYLLLYSLTRYIKRSARPQVRSIRRVDSCLVPRAEKILTKWERTQYNKFLFTQLPFRFRRSLNIKKFTYGISRHRTSRHRTF